MGLRGMYNVILGHLFLTVGSLLLASLKALLSPINFKALYFRVSSLDGLRGLISSELNYFHLL